MLDAGYRLRRDLAPLAMDEVVFGLRFLHRSEGVQANVERDRGDPDAGTLQPG